MNQEIISEIQLTLYSDIKYLDIVQAVSDSFSNMAGFNDEDLYWVGLSVREAVQTLYCTEIKMIPLFQLIFLSGRKSTGL